MRIGTMVQKKKNNNVFEKMVTEMLKETGGTTMLKECMTFDPSVSEKVPLRYRIIALGFVSRMSLDQLNKKLQEEGCPALYSRNYWESGLIFAFLNKMSFSEWKGIQAECEAFRRTQEIESLYFKKSSISLKDLESYLKDNSEQTPVSNETRHLTRVMQEKIRQASNTKEKFKDFLMTNFNSFSEVREKSRYYFCKYLACFLRTRINNYFNALETGLGVEPALEDLAVFKGLSKLKRKKMSSEEILELLENAPISCGELFDAFNMFYFDYVSLDWMDVLLDYYGNIEALPDDSARRLAASIRRYNPSYVSLSDREVLRKTQEEMDAKEEALDHLYSLQGSNRGYQTNRAGENTLRKYIKGSLDIDRTTLICFLLFFSHEAELEKDQILTRERLDDILLECGFAALRQEDDFDYFVLEFIRSNDPISYLMEEVTDYALNEQNFYLYQMYRASSSQETDFKKIMGIK